MQVQTVLIISVSLISRSHCYQELSESASEARMLGLDTGNPAADHEAGMWIAGLIGKHYQSSLKLFNVHPRYSDGGCACGSLKPKFGIQTTKKICKGGEETQFIRDVFIQSKTN